MRYYVTLLCLACAVIGLRAEITYVRPDVLGSVVQLVQEEAQVLGVQSSWPCKLCQKVTTQEAFASEVYADALALRYCQAHDSTMLVLICSRETLVSAEIFGQILDENITVLYVKKIPLCPQGWRNLHSFFDCQWYGNAFNDAKNLMLHVGLIISATGKQRPALAGKSSVTSRAKSCAIAFVTEPSKVLSLAQTCFNSNSLHFLNHARPAQFKTFNALIPIFRKFLCDRAMKTECFCVDTSAVLSAYGIRDCQDFDFIHHGHDELLTQCPNGSELNSHNKGSLRYHSVKKDDLIFNPANYFYYEGIKFIVLHEVVAMKKKRNSKKDQNDIKLVNEFFKKSYGSPFSVCTCAGTIT